MLAGTRAPEFLLGERELRRMIDRAVSRALVDVEYGRALLGDPTLVLADRGCSAQHYLSLRSIDAKTVLEFARQAWSLFWVADPPVDAPDPRLNPTTPAREHQRSLADAAVR